MSADHTERDLHHSHLLVSTGKFLLSLLNFAYWSYALCSKMGDIKFLVCVAWSVIVSMILI